MDKTKNKLGLIIEELQCGGDSDELQKVEQKQKAEIMQLLHEYNEIKDATQIVLGALANMQGLTIKEMHKKFDLPLND